MAQWTQLIVLFVLSICLLMPILFNMRQMPTYIRPAVHKPRNCGGDLKGIVLAINYNWPKYAFIPILKRFYGGVFGKVVFCGNDKHEEVIQIIERRGFYGYECVQRAIELYPNFTGYIHSSDDVLLQWWNVIHLDKDKFWLGTNIYESAKSDSVYNIKTQTPKRHPWWDQSDPTRICAQAFHSVINSKLTAEGKKFDFQHHIKNFHLNSRNRDICLGGRSDFFYVPRRFALAYAKMSQIYRKKNVHLEVAIPTLLLFFLNESNFIDINGVYLPDRYQNTKYALGNEFEDIFSYQTSFYHPFKLSNTKNLHLFKEIIMTYSNLIRVTCLI